MIKNILYALLAVPFVASVCPAVNDDSIMSQLSATPSLASLHTFNQIISSNRWKAPAIHSKWYLDRESDSEKRREGVKSRRLGKNIVEHLDGWAEELLLEKSVNRNLAIVTDLLNFSDWLTEVPGYGNYLLAARCQDIASIGIGRVLVDVDVPLATSSSLVARLDSPWQTFAARAVVLNTEARTNLFPINSVDASNMLEEVWRNGQMLVLKHSSPDVMATFEGRNQEGFSDLAEIIKTRKVKLVETSLFMQNLDFFKDDPVGAHERNVTMLSKWDAKWHGKLVTGLESMNTRKLKALLTFRQYVGVFPEKPTFTTAQRVAAREEIETASKQGLRIVPYEAAYSSSGEAAFAQAWKRFATHETRNLDSVAWQAYKEITAGDFADEDTREKRLAVKMGTIGVRH